MVLPHEDRRALHAAVAALALALVTPEAAIAQPTNGSVDPPPTPTKSLVTLSFEDAKLGEVVHAMSVMTGRRFVIAATPKSFVANVVSPQKVTVDEAYQALLSVLLANHLTVVPSGPFFKIVDTLDASHEAPVRGLHEGVPHEERFVTYVHRVKHVRADDVASNVLQKLASHDGTVLAFGSALIVTDTGTNIDRMMRVLEDIDVAGVEDKVWLEPLEYAIANDVKKEIDELLDLKGTPGKDAHKEATTARVTRVVAIDRPNAVLIVGTEGGYERLLALLKQIDVPQLEGGQMHVVMLAHAEAKKLVTALNEAVTAAQGSASAGKDARQPLGILDSPAKVSAEETNNALIVTASAHDFVAIRDVIKRLDQPRRQVYIEAVVMDLSVSDTTQLGAALHGFGDLSNSLGPGAVAYGGVNPLNSLALPTDTTTLQGLVLGLRGPNIPVPGFLQSTLGTSSIPGVGFLIDASTVAQDSDIVQSPSVMTTDNVPAELHVQLNTSLQRNAASVALPTTGAATGAASATSALSSYLPYSAPASQNYGKIGPMLQVTPHLNDSDDVRLDIEETISDLTPDPPQGTLGTVNFIERHALTTMTVKDGSTAVVGGLVRDTVQHTSTKVPVLGDVPVLGFFFRSTSDVMSKANLVLVLTPHIIRDEEDMRRVVTKRMEERQEFLDHYLLFHKDTGPPIGFDPVRGKGLLEWMKRDGARIEEEREAARGAVRPRLDHEPRAPLELPAGPVIEPRELPVVPTPPANRPLTRTE
jgi:general secretion pathway protein D